MPQDYRFSVIAIVVAVVVTFVLIGLPNAAMGFLLGASVALVLVLRPGHRP